MEDYHLALAFGGQHTGFYIDVGAGHPVADNVFLWFYERGWKGIVAEPQDDLARLYGSIRPADIVYQGLIGASTGEPHSFMAIHCTAFLSPFKTFLRNPKTSGLAVPGPPPTGGAAPGASGGASDLGWACRMDTGRRRPSAAL